MRLGILRNVAVLLSMLLPGPVCLIAAGYTTQDSNSGSLDVINPRGSVVSQCPLKHTAVDSSISGPVARVTVTQEFKNSETQKIEAVYTFPLPHDSAIDEMTIHVGSRTVRGLIKKREEARQIYEDARNQGHLAGLLDQERPNIFTQSVANIQPGEAVKIEISYVQLLPFSDGRYEFRFPMVVGPRYIPGQPVGRGAGGWSPDTTQVPDASRITPQVTPKGTRAGHDISVSVDLDAGVPLDDIRSTTHLINIRRSGSRQASVQLVDQATIPNKDFVLTYDVTGRGIEDAVLTHTDKRGGFLTLLLTPPDRPSAARIVPKELVFVLDTSGSMSGFPIEKAKEAMREALHELNPNDTFNLITFSGSTEILFPQPVPATPFNLAAAQAFLESRRGAGGTEMMKAIQAALEPSDSSNHLRVVCFMTDGYVGNDMQILGEIQKHSNARVFAFGIGNAVNHYLLDRMAAYGRGEVEYVGLQDDGSAAARRFIERVRSPVLTDIQIDWGGLDINDFYPQRIPDLFSAKPISISARYGKPAAGLVRITGKQAGHSFVREIPVELPAQSTGHDELATLWARRKVESLMAGDLSGIQVHNPNSQVCAEITQLGLDYRLLTQFTSFVAVEERTVNDHGQPRRIDVPVEMPEGVSYQGVFGTEMYPSAATAAKAMYFVPNSGTSGRTIQVEGGVAGAMALPSRIETEPAPLRSIKLHQTLADIVARFDSRRSLTSDEQSLFRNGKIRITVEITGRAAIAQLRALGFEEEAKASRGLVLAGVISPSQLARLAEAPGVVFIGPRP